MLKFNYRINQTIIDRGIECFQLGKVNSVYKLSDKMYMASVSGERKYEVYINVENEGIENSVCTCPCHYTCKHIVATSMYVSENKNKIIQTNKYNVEDIKMAIEVVDNFNASINSTHYGSSEKYFIRGELEYEQINFNNISKELKGKVENSFNSAKDYEC